MPQKFETLKAAVILERLCRKYTKLEMTHIKKSGNASVSMELQVKRKGNKFHCYHPKDSKNKNWGEIKINTIENYINIGGHTFKLDEFAYLAGDRSIMMDPMLPTCRRIVGTQRRLSLVEDLSV